MTIMLVIVVSYTILGGMFSIVITDFMQFVVLAFGMLVATIAVLLRVDLAAMSAAVSGTLGSSGVNPFANPRFGWTFVVWIFVSSVAAGALWQPGTSKALASKVLLWRRKYSFGRDSRSRDGR
jgi:solute:Na+ symporter, SSS family